MCNCTIYLPKITAMFKKRINYIHICLEFMKLCGSHSHGFLGAMNLISSRASHIRVSKVVANHDEHIEGIYRLLLKICDWTKRF